MSRTANQPYTGRFFSNLGTGAYNFLASFTNVPYDIADQLIQESRFIYYEGVGAYLGNAGRSVANSVSSTWNYTINTPLSDQLKGEWQLMQNPDYWTDAAGQSIWMLAPIYLLNGVKFDGFTNNILMDAKSAGFANFVKSNGTFQPWFRGAQELLDQATRQVGAANGARIQYFFQEQRSFNAT